MPKRRIVDEFLASRETQTSSKDSPYTEVQLFLSAHARSYTRLRDFALDGTGLEGFINHYADGKMSFLPEHRDDVPLKGIQADLSELSRKLGVDPPQVRIGEHSYLQTVSREPPGQPASRLDQSSPNKGSAVRVPSGDGNEAPRREQSP
jgi:hypothetical protein